MNTPTELVFVFADLAGFTALTETHGDLDAADIAARFYAIAREALDDDARLIKTIGDAVMIVAGKPVTGVAVAQRMMAALERLSGFPALHMGIHAGPAVERNGDYFGAAVNLAARVAAYARAGQIVSTEAAAMAVQTDQGLQVVPLGTAQLKNVAQPTPLFLIEDRQRRSDALAVDPVCRMRIDPEAAPARLPWRDQRYVFCSLTCAQAFLQSPDAYTSA